MKKNLNLLKTGDLFVWNCSEPELVGTYHFRFLRWDRTSQWDATFFAVLENIVQENLPYYERKGLGFIENFYVRSNTEGQWLALEVIEETKEGEHCTKCAVRLEWASLALKCPKCWKVY